MKKAIWESDNKVWGILDVRKDKDLSVVQVVNYKKVKTKSVYIEHVKAGDELLLESRVADKDEDRVLEKNLPKYLEEKLIELTTN